MSVNVPILNIVAPSVSKVDKTFSIIAEVEIDDLNRIESVNIDGLRPKQKQTQTQFSLYNDKAKYIFGLISISQNTTFKVIVRFDGGNEISKSVEVKLEN